MVRFNPLTVQKGTIGREQVGEIVIFSDLLYLGMDPADCVRSQTDVTIMWIFSNDNYGTIQRNIVIDLGLKTQQFMLRGRGRLWRLTFLHRPVPVRL